MKHALLIVLIVGVLSSCARKSDQLFDVPPPRFTASDGKNLPIAIWNAQARPKTVIIGLHGLTGAARDYGNLGHALSGQSPSTMLYAINLRGQGYDPAVRERGDIKGAALWKRDLQEFSTLMRLRHPEARLVWMGESMGSLIVMHAAAEAAEPPDAIILSSPIVSLEQLPAWQRLMLTIAAQLCPMCRVSLKNLAGGDFRATGQGNHFEQVKKNEYQVDWHTLRFLKALGMMANEMPSKAKFYHGPVLILQGGKDPLGNENAISIFAMAFSGEVKRVLSPQSHHLLFYDKNHNEMIARTLRWLD